MPSINESWKTLVEKYKIAEKIQRNGLFHITATQIKEYKEPRLMASFNYSASLPKILKDEKINILPTSRSSYVLGNFNIYHPVPSIAGEKVFELSEISDVRLPDFETIDVNEIGSEANAINVLVLTKILDDFLGIESSATFNGRMGTGEFDFTIDSIDGFSHTISVKNAQCEIDGGFESENEIIILEAKNVLYDDFNVRQLYYPFRTWEMKVSKPIRLVFAIYTNKIFRLTEYRFSELNNYSSITIVQSKNYSVDDTTITIEELRETRSKTIIRTDDNKDSDSVTVPFIQADNFERVISLLENLYENPLTVLEIAELMQFDKRQSDYYFNAGNYLGLFEKRNLAGVGEAVYLTEIGELIHNMSYKSRQLKLVSLILEHQIFADLFDYVNINGFQPAKIDVMLKMSEYNVVTINSSTHKRRATTVSAWLQWIFDLLRG